MGVYHRRPLLDKETVRSVQQFFPGDDVLDGERAEEVVADAVGEIVVLVQGARLQDQAVAIAGLIGGDETSDEILLQPHDGSLEGDAPAAPTGAFQDEAIPRFEVEGDPAWSELLPRSVARRDVEHPGVGS